MLDGKDRGDGDTIAAYPNLHAEHEKDDHLIDAAEQEKKKAKRPSRINLEEHRHLRTALKDQLSAPIDEYRVAGEGKKEAGVSSGFVGTTAEQSNYMLKPGNLDRITDDGKKGNATPYADKRDAMQEYIAAVYINVFYMIVRPL